MNEVKEQNGKKKENLPTSYRAGVTAKQIWIWPIQRLITGANEAVVTDYGIIVTSSFSETKGVLFFIQQKVPRGCPRKNVFFHIRNISKRKQASGKKHAEHCLRHLNKTACEI